MPRVFTHERLARMGAPTLLLVGELERIYRPEKAASAARRRMPSLQVGLIPHAHHVPAIANPDAVSAWITEFSAINVTQLSPLHGAEPKGVSLPANSTGAAGTLTRPGGGAQRPTRASDV